MKRSPITGDEVYYYLDGVPAFGEVLSTGQHGCRISHPEKPDGHCAIWEDILGVKKSLDPSYNVDDEGEDGMIVTDAKGYKRFISHGGDVLNPDPDQAPQSNLAFRHGTRVSTAHGTGSIQGRSGKSGAHVKLDTGTVVQVSWPDMFKYESEE